MIFSSSPRYQLRLWFSLWWHFLLLPLSVVINCRPSTSFLSLLSFDPIFRSERLSYPSASRDYSSPFSHDQGITSPSLVLLAQKTSPVFSDTNHKLEFMTNLKQNRYLQKAWQQKPLLFKRHAKTMIDYFTVKDFYEWIGHLEKNINNKNNHQGESNSGSLYINSLSTLDAIGYAFTANDTGWIMGSLTKSIESKEDNYESGLKNTERETIDSDDIQNVDGEYRHQLQEKSVKSKIDRILTSSKNQTIVLNDAGVLAGAPIVFQDFCQEALRVFNFPVSLNVYITGNGELQSAPPHSDYQDILVVQVEGKKKWKIFSPTATTNSKEDNINIFARGKYEDKLGIDNKTNKVFVIPKENEDEREAKAKAMIRLENQKKSSLLLETILEPGDVLYVPAGFIHTTSTSNLYDDDDYKQNLSGISNSSTTALPASASVHLTLGIDTHIWGLTYATLRDIIIANILHHQKKRNNKDDEENPQVMSTLQKQQTENYYLNSLKFPSAIRYNHLPLHQFLEIHQSLFQVGNSIPIISFDSSQSQSQNNDFQERKEILKKEIKRNLLSIDETLREDNQDSRFKQDPDLNKHENLPIIDLMITTIVDHYKEVMQLFCKLYPQYPKGKSEKELQKEVNDVKITFASSAAVEVVEEKTEELLASLSFAMNSLILEGYPAIKEAAVNQIKQEKEKATS